MSEIRVGDAVYIPCDVKPGPFSDEMLISLDTVHGPISGFVRDTELKEMQQRQFVMGRVRNVSDDVIEVRIKGEFFTTAGLASVQRNSAHSA